MSKDGRRGHFWIPAIYRGGPGCDEAGAICDRLGVLRRGRRAYCDHCERCEAMRIGIAMQSHGKRINDIVAYKSKKDVDFSKQKHYPECVVSRDVPRGT